MYGEFMSEMAGVVHVMLPNHENLFKNDVERHKKMDVFLCKTHVCVELVTRYIKKESMKADVWYVGHASLDPTISAGSKADTDYNRFLHVRGKSPLKHTTEIMRCWLSRPDFPHLTVVGDMTMSKIQYNRLKAAGNIDIVPAPWIGERGNMDFRNLSMLQLHTLQASSGVHLCPSRREGFGHYINEARAVSALVLTTDHPPMNELVKPDFGVLVRGRGGVDVFAAKIAALASYANHSMFLSSASICKGVERILGLSQQDRLRKGTTAREAFLLDRWQYIRDMALVMDRLLLLMGNT